MIIYENKGGGRRKSGKFGKMPFYMDNIYSWIGDYEGSGHIDQLPNEILEYIFKLISPYADFSACYR